MKIISSAIGLICFIAFLGFGVGSTVIVPPYALAFLDDSRKVYITLPCVDEWRTRPTQTIDILRRSTVGEAYKFSYMIDEKCRDAGGYVADGRSLTGLMLERVGILSPLTYWWDRPYRTEDGTIVYPGK